MNRIIALLFAAATAAIAETVTLTPVQDSDVYSYPGDGNPTSTTFSLGVNSTPPTYPTLHSQKSLIQFDLSSLPFPASEIGSAVLRLFVFPPDPTYGALYPGDVHVHRQAVAWSVTATTPKWPTFQSVEHLGSFPVLESSANQWVQYDLTPTTVGWAAGTYPNHGIFLAPLTDRMTPSLNVTFASMEVEGYRPQLVITRKPADPKLSIRNEGGAYALAWPVTGSEGWIIERADSPAGPWTSYIGSAVANGGSWEIHGTTASTREFFRLARY